MSRLLSFCVVVFFFFVTSTGCLSQTIPGHNLPPFNTGPQCPTNLSAPPISPRTVQVDVPVPCAPAACGPVMLNSPNPCGPLVCAPPRPIQPVQVRVDVVVRPESPKPCPPINLKCEKPPVFEPFFYQAAGIIDSLIALPLFYWRTAHGTSSSCRST